MREEEKEKDVILDGLSVREHHFLEVKLSLTTEGRNYTSYFSSWGKDISGKGNRQQEQSPRGRGGWGVCRDRREASVAGV